MHLMQLGNQTWIHFFSNLTGSSYMPISDINRYDYFFSVMPHEPKSITNHRKSITNHRQINFPLNGLFRLATDKLSKAGVNPHETARYGEIASAILNFFVCCMEMG